MSTIIIITPPPKKDPAAPDYVVTNSVPASDYTAAISLIEAAEAVGSTVRVIHAD